MGQSIRRSMLSLPMIISWSADGRSLIRGIGISKEYLEKIFEPFTQENMDARSVYHGTGLGMSIAKALFEQMGGTIEISSTPGYRKYFCDHFAI